MNKAEGLRVMVAGSGGREQALAWRLAQSRRIARIDIAPGNAGTAFLRGHAHIRNIDVGYEDIDGLLKHAADNNVDFTVIGPEAPLTKGVVNAFDEANKKIFGPDQKAAVMESSKIITGMRLEKWGVPIPISHFPDNNEHGLHLAATLPYQLVVKGDGLAGGKDAIVTSTPKEAIAATQRFIDQGKQYMFQERLFGQEISYQVLVDGKTALPLLPAQDYKEFEGKNSGGMGAYARVPHTILPLEMEQRIIAEIIHPTVEGMRAEDIDYQGILYGGIILTDDGPKALEFNCRFGDPETQPIMMLLDEDLLGLLEATTDRKLHERGPAKFRDGYAVCTVLVENGYPGSYETGHVIYNAENVANDENHQLFQAGTKINGKRELVTAGGRVLGATAYGVSIQEAIDEVETMLGEKNNGAYFETNRRRFDIAVDVA